MSAVLDLAAHDSSSQPDAGLVLAKATSRSAALLGLNGSALARVIGTSEATISRITRGERPLEPQSKPGELALLLVRLFRSLDAMVGNDATQRLAWMAGYNQALGGVPAQLVLSAAGLAAAVSYLDAMRAPA